MPTKKKIQKDKPFELKVGPTDSARIDRFLAARHPEWSRTRLQRLINGRFVTVDGHPVSPNHKLKPGQTIRITWPEVKPAVAGKKGPLPVPVIFQDDEFFVINKPANLLVHPAGAHTVGTSLVDMIRPFVSSDGWSDATRPGLVHRLDRDTSGVIVIAKNPHANEKISRQFANRQVKKTYLGIVRGVPSAKEGTLESHIARHPGKRQQFAVADSGRHAVTQFRVTEEFQNAALLELHPLTGRTHQIRVHLTGYGHPILGDRIYGIADQSFSFVPRQMLHAHRLEFRHPETGKSLVFEAPIPDDFQAVLKVLRSRA